MGLITKGVVHHRKAIIAVFAVLTVISAVLYFGVRVNFNLTDYLPQDSESTKALEIMQEEFSSAVPTARVMVPGVSLTEALDMKSRIGEIDGVTEVLWLDDVIDLKQPLEIADPATVADYYKDGAALYTVTVAEGREVEATNALYALIGEDGAVTGNAVTVASAQNMVVGEIVGAVEILLPLIILILLLTTTTWIAPLLILGTIAVAVVINLGTNIIFGEVSYITQSVSPILQLAVSLDYAIFLLNSFDRFRKETDDAEEAMRLAIRQSFSAIAASAMTTVFGFLALIFMRFGIGSDLGLNLMKGVLLSYVSVMVLMPSLALVSIKFLDKTRHKRIVPDLSGLGKGLVKVRIPIIAFLIILVIPCFLAQSKTDFLYGNGEPESTTRFGRDSEMIDESFGKASASVLLVPRGDPGREAELCSQLEELPHVTSVVSYAETVGSSIPDGFLEKNVTSTFYSDHYARIIVYTDTADEGEDAFATVEAIRGAASDYYDESYLCGQSANLYDIKNVVTQDSQLVNLIAIALVFLTLLVTFKSVTLPFVLVFVIESAIWINLAVPYFMGTPFVYIGFLIINTVQLGATIDYAILLTDGYVNNRKLMGKREAVIKTVNVNFISILTSGLILSSAGFCLFLESSQTIVLELGVLLGRGTLLSMTLVLVALPGLLMLFDPITAKTTRHADFFKGEAK